MKSIVNSIKDFHHKINDALAEAIFRKAIESMTDGGKIDKEDSRKVIESFKVKD